MSMRLLSILLTAAVMSVGLVPTLTGAQEGITLKLAIPPFQEEFLTDEIIAPFEAETGYNVEIVVRTFNAPFAASNLEGHLDTVADYARAADVLVVESGELAPEATRAGYILDLAPLTNGDTTLYPEDFFPAAWQSFQWDQGVWALPVAVDIISLNYNPEDFDEAGLAYPNEQWTMEDLVFAARELTEYDEEGNTTMPGVQANGTDLTLLLRALAGQGFYDTSTLPETPYIANPALEPVMETWIELEDDGVNTMPEGEIAVSLGDNPIPLRIDSSFDLLPPAGGDEINSLGAPLPGGIVGLDAYGFAVSAGTMHPEAAYQLAKHLTNNAQVAANFLAPLPARQSLVGVSESDERLFGPREFPPEIQNFFNEAIWYAIPASELRYGDYIALAFTKMRAMGMDAATALQEAEVEAVDNLQAAANRRDTDVVLVATPIPEAQLAPGEVALDFGYQSFVSPLPNQDQWQEAIDAFVAADPEVGQVVFKTDFGFALPEMAREFDCFFLNYNAVPDLDPQAFLNLDPFIDADPSFDRADVVGNVTTELQRDNKIWAYPVAIQPSILRYNAEQFQQAGLPPPEDGWTIDQFIDALHLLKDGPDDPAPFVPRGLGGTYMLMLVAAHGGLPIDYRTVPPTIAFTDPANIDAIRQTLDLAVDGYIDYKEMGGFGSGAGALMVNFGNQETEAAIYPDSLDIFGFSFGFDFGGEDPARRTAYPRGNRFSPASYTINTAYISATADNPNACYRWLGFIAERPELFSAMPARRSLLDAPSFTASTSQEQIDFYRDYADFLQDPNTVIFPSFGVNVSGAGNFFYQQWLFRAFDRYVLEEADLEAELADAQIYATSYQDCTANIPPYDPEVYPEPNEYAQLFADCVIRIDPSFESMLGNMGQ